MNSKTYKNWKAILDLKTCIDCRSRHGKIFLAEESINPIPPLHEKCRCLIEFLKSLQAGSATKLGQNGADWWLKQMGRLPDYYISDSEAKQKGFRQYLGNLSNVAPGKMLFKGEYKNRNEHLPLAEGRIWYEADINYTWGYRGSERIIFSNDGLIFVTYDHYKTFYAIE